MSDDEEGGGIERSPRDMVVRLAFGVVYMAAISYVSYAAVKHADWLEVRARGYVAEGRRRVEAARQWRRDRNLVLFEAYHATREAAEQW